MNDRLRHYYNLASHHLYYLTLPVRYFLQGRTARVAGTQAYTLSYDPPKYMPFRHLKGDIHVRTSEEWGKRNKIVGFYVWSGWRWIEAYRAEASSPEALTERSALYLHVWAQAQSGHFLPKPE